MYNFNSVAIVCNSQYEDLYKESSYFYKDLPFDKIRIDGSNGFYGLKFLNNLIKTCRYDWVILIDEDCFVSDVNEVVSLLKFQMKNNYAFSGPPDGGVMTYRNHNPVAINTFFSILNLKKIKSVYREKVAMRTVFNVRLKKHTPFHLINPDILYKYNNFEPYYRIFFHCINKNLKPLYLDVENLSLKDDKWSTILKSHDGKNFAYHSWFSREWKAGHKKRITKLINMARKNQVKWSGVL